MAYSRSAGDKGSVVQRWAHSSLGRSLHDRECGGHQRHANGLRSIYGNSNWISDLDIVNELSGHSGCVNALSWSKSGRLLASGSDDKHVNVYRYQPDDASTQFSLATTVATGHTANIFSVKFMPHSNDRTLVSVAGDNEVRIFDLEHSGMSNAPSHAADMASHARQRRRGALYDGVRFLTDGNTNCRVYRSHGERVKRIVTESSPHLFLTCSEDGEVRQWDLRQPSSAYPAPRYGRRLEADSEGVPPPLISYKRYGLDLNTISCSPSQPHYIALGGAHLHCLLHDRRMIGRDRSLEEGRPGFHAEQTEVGMELMGQATRCVRKFAPNGQQRMRSSDSGHITACKISDTNPNEIVVSWSGDSIYSFDLVRSPGVGEDHKENQSIVSPSKSNQLISDTEKKRKRAGASSSPSREEEQRAGSRQKTEEAQTPNPESQEMALRVQYGNGQTEDIPIQPPSIGSGVSGDRTSIMRNDLQRAADDLARRMIRLRSVLFEPRSARPSSSKDVTGYASSFTTVLGFCASTLPEMKRIHSSWSYPVDPSLHELTVQRKLRADRETCIRFIQAAGVTARVLGGRLQSAASVNSSLAMFDKIHVLSTEGPDLDSREQFHFDFLKAVFLWLDSGVGALLAGFSVETAPSGKVRRFPVPPDAGTEAVDEILIPYLLSLAGNRPIPNVDCSRFEVDENQIVFISEHEAVRQFAEALKKPFADLSSGRDPSFDDQSVQDRSLAIRYWGLTVARGILKNCSDHLRSPRISLAFGGLGVLDSDSTSQEQQERERQQDIDVMHEDTNVAAGTVQLLSNEDPGHGADTTQASPVLVSELADALREEDVGTDLQPMDTSHDLTSSDVEEQMGAAGTTDVGLDHGRGHNGVSDDDDDETEDAGNSDDDEEGEEEEEEHDDDDDDDEEPEEDEDDEGVGGIPRRFYRSTFKRSGFRTKVEPHVPCAPHTRVYRGHCNVQTVKDVNFFGLNDEYVVSGSDDGNLFIWDRKTTKLVNILEGDGEVVNVIQGHPYEPLLAVSGIDDTIKIFSPDARARMAARLGSGVEAADASTFSSINWPSRAYGRRLPRRTSDAVALGSTAENGGSGTEQDSQKLEEDDEFIAPNGFPSRKRLHLEYQITSQNDSRRQNGAQEAFITIEDILAMFFRRAG
ncbi:WD40 repeat-like protein [Myriangium duriaei CBS 260.36]|uniref:WD40 repeat-like protein n=1 Tax=Myriangium duriaei CBS 260.36 TaxID=1168546 RepID=A0A9P4JBN1_9PEZI|nr:WD40 repeat-like protein [Myriangium duriaei CBS 260.36]